MVKRMSLLFLVFALFTGAQLFVGCDMSGSDSSDSDPSLEGYWKSSYGDGFEIDGESYKQYDDSDKSVSFAGTIVNDPDLEAAAGYIIIQITDGGTWGKTVGKYYALHYKDFADDAVKQSSATAADYTDPINNGVDTQAEAETEYTIANGYFSYYGDYERQ